ncbi:MAG TPA: hypothetical protein VD884_07865 [Ohtaekwangia sp.]|nr:hypothetical protein [Ohtaekwangia sp.]
MKELKNKAETLTEHVSEYIETYMAYSILKATDRAAGIAAVSITTVIVALLGFFFLLFIGIGLGYLIGQQLNNMFAGFAIVAGFFALLIVLILVMKKSVFGPYFRNLIIKSTYE